MSAQEREELGALASWLETFPQIQEATASKAKTRKKKNKGGDPLDDPKLASYVDLNFLVFLLTLGFV